MTELDKHTQPRLHVVLCGEGHYAFTEPWRAANMAKMLRLYTAARDVRIVEYVAVRIRDS